MSEEKAFEIIERLCNNGCKAYLTGGVVRDLFSGKTPNDYDIVTEATIEQLGLFFKNINTVGKSFEVCVINGVEVAGYRKDFYFGLSDKNCKIEAALTLEEDLSRRDLTINSMAFCPFTNELVDPYNGKQDLSDRIIRFTGNPIERIYEDPCRIIRACRFLGLLNGVFDETTFLALKNNVNLLSHVSNERKRLEVLKALKYRRTSLFFRALDSIGALGYIFPSLTMCNVDGGKHHRETVFDHSMIVGDSISSRHGIVKLAGYLHDIGKPKAYANGSFVDHELYGAEIAADELRSLKFSNDEIDKICNLIKFHMFDIKNSGSKGMRRFIKKLKDAHLSCYDYSRLKFADSTGNLMKGAYTVSQKKDMINKFESELAQKETIFDIKSLALSGNDVMDILGIQPGVEVGNALRFLYERVMDSPGLNTKEKLCQLLKNLPNNN